MGCGEKPNDKGIRGTDGKAGRDTDTRSPFLTRGVKGAGARRAGQCIRLCRVVSLE